MEKPVTTRLSEECIIKLKNMAEKENIDFSTAVRKLLNKAIKEWKIEYALKQYSNGNYSFGETVKFAEISPWDLPNLFKKHKIEVNYDIEEFYKDLETIKWIN